MADHELWRKNLPPGFEGRHGEDWDDEIPMKPIIWSTVAVAVSVIIAFVFCWGLIVFFDDLRGEPDLSPIAEFNERREFPRPWLQPKPEVELEAMQQQLRERLGGYGWSDQLEGFVHIPVDEAKEIVLAGAGAPEVAVEPAADQPVDVEPEEAATDESTANSATDESAAAEESTGEGENGSAGH